MISIKNDYSKYIRLLCTQYYIYIYIVQLTLLEILYIKVSNCFIYLVIVWYKYLFWWLSTVWDIIYLVTNFMTLIINRVRVYISIHNGAVENYRQLQNILTPSRRDQS